MKTVFLHGLGGCKEDWEKIKISHPTHLVNIEGKTDFFSTCEALALELQKLGEPIYLVGYSMGGRIALQISELLPKNILKGLALLSTGLGFSLEQERKKRIELDEKWAKLAEENPQYFWKSWYEQELFTTFHSLDEAKKTPWIRSRMQISPHKIANQFRNLGQGMHSDLSILLEKRQKQGVPLLYVAGEKDKKYADLAKSLEAKGILTGLAPKVGHILPLEAPEFLVEKLEDFLK